MMYQIYVTEGKMERPVGPAASARRLLEPLTQMINESVAKGAEKYWHDARIVPISNVRRIIQ